MPKTLTEWLKEQRELCENSTQEEWWNESGVTHCKAPEWTPEVHACIHPGSFERDEDAEFAAQAHQSLPTALRIIEAWKGKCERVIHAPPNSYTANPPARDFLTIAERIINKESHA